MAHNSNDMLEARPIIKAPGRTRITAVARHPAQDEGGLGRPRRAPRGARAARRALIVLGMHRSGTSSLTRVLGLAGAALPSNILPACDGLPNDGNSKAGFWESKPLLRLHEEALVSAGSAWDDVSDIPPSWFDSEVARAFKHRLVETLGAEFGKAPFFVAKDPRISRLAPLWQAALAEMDVEANWLIAVRNPFEVAASLTERDRFSQPKGLLLWLSYFLAAERNTRGQKRLFIQFDQVLDDWRGVIERIEAQLDLSFPRLNHLAAAETDDFLDRSLRHHTLTSTETTSRQDLFDLARHTSRLASRAADGESGLVEQLDEIHHALRQAESVYGPLLASVELEGQRTRELLAETVEELQEAISEQGQLIARTNAEVEALRQQAREQQQTDAAMVCELDQTFERLRDARTADIDTLCKSMADEREDLIQQVRELEGRLVGFQRLDLAGRAAQPTRRLWFDWRYGVLGLVVKFPFWMLSLRLRRHLTWWRQARRILRSGLFDQEFYRRQHPEIEAAQADPLDHYVRHGAAAGFDPNPFFSSGS